MTRDRTPRRQRRLLPHWLHGLLLTMLLAACGGVGEEGTGATVESASVGVLKGIDDDSITVNGVVYDRRSAQVVDGFGQPLGADALRLGQWLEVQGLLDEAGTQGVAQRIRVRAAARGVVAAKDAQGAAITVLDATVRVANGTVFEGIASTTALTVGDTVEVHGPVAGASGEFNASRVEKIGAAGAGASTPALPFELRGRVSRLDTVARTLTVGRRTVSYAAATVTLRNALAEGQMVRVSSASAPVPGQPWVVERLTADQPLPASLGFVYTEGFVEDLLAGPLFALEGLAVDARTAAGRAALTANGQRVAVVGSLANGALLAKALAVIEPGEPVVFTLSAAITDFVSPADFRLRGVGIDASAASFVSPATPATLANGVRIRVKGTVLGRRLIAMSVERAP